MSELLSDARTLERFLAVHPICALYFSAPDCAVCGWNDPIRCSTVAVDVPVPTIRGYGGRGSTGLPPSAQRSSADLACHPPGLPSGRRYPVVCPVGCQNGNRVRHRRNPCILGVDVSRGGVIDLFARRVVGWAAADHMRLDLVSDALTMAVWRRRPAPGLIHHSDRGSQYACQAYQDFSHEQGIVRSMSRKGNCWDNAPVERFFGSLKRERTDLHLYATREEIKADVIDYIEMFYNSQRQHSSLGYTNPMEFEAKANAA